MDLRDCFVRDVMSDSLITVEPETLLLDAALALRSNSIRHLPVLEGGRLVGLISDRDIQRCAPSRLIPITEEDYNSVFADTTVRKIMTREPVSVTPDMPLVAAMGIMQQGRYGCLPVMDKEELVGILTRSDLVDALQRLLCGKPVSRSVVAR
jgi:acetoin utilization protein AcuB